MPKDTVGHVCIMAVTSRMEAFPMVGKMYAYFP